MGDDYSTMQIKEIKCPFCQEGIIKAHYRPSMRSFKTSRSASASKSVPIQIKEKYTVLTDKCPNCGKSKAEIEKRLKGDDSVPISEAVKRAKEAGLPLRF